ncbi:MAG: NAD(P)H-dependent oxidoreductase subunit E [Spirochaetota bacterium]
MKNTASKNKDSVSAKKGGTFVERVIERYQGDQGMLIPMLQDIQAEHGYLPPEAMRELAAKLGVPLMRVYSVSTFYASFMHAPRGQHEVILCMGTVCYLKGANKILETICEEYRVQPGGTTEDRLFTLQGVNCVGACALAPVMIVDGNYHGGVTPESALELIAGLARGESGNGGGKKEQPAGRKKKKAGDTE